jgi:hypothetical protein
MDKTAKRHLDAINSGQVEKTNVIGIRKVLNHAWRLRHGYSGNRCNATVEDGAALVAALVAGRPLVRGDLHASGVRTITDKRYAKRLASVADKVAALHGFRLVGFQEVGGGHHLPIYMAVGTAGPFKFFHVPWQGAEGYGLEAGPHLVA